MLKWPVAAIFSDPEAHERYHLQPQATATWGRRQAESAVPGKRALLDDPICQKHPQFIAIYYANESSPASFYPFLYHTSKGQGSINGAGKDVKMCVHVTVRYHVAAQPVRHWKHPTNEREGKGQETKTAPAKRGSLGKSQWRATNWVIAIGYFSKH